MSTGDEFSFIRCASCNSLIPSKATRCRMCGYVLSEGGEAEAKKSEPADSGDKRVTQKTVNIKSVDLDDIREKITTVDEREEPEVIDEPDIDASSDDDMDDSDDSDSSKRSRRNRRSRKKRPREEAVETPVREQRVMEPQRPRPAAAPKAPEGNSVMFEQASYASGSELSPLVGWFVSYGENKAGITYEVRSGRVLITREALRPSDVVLDDSQLSTPHCILKATADGGISIQDLMSEHGTLVKTSAKGKFKTCDGPTSLNTGDIVKLGATEMLVVLVPQTKPDNDESSKG